VKRREVVLGVIGGLLLLAPAIAERLSPAHPPPKLEKRVLAGGCSVPVTAYLQHPEPRSGVAVVFHGLGANRVVMTGLGRFLHSQGLDVYLADLPGHGDHTDGFTFERAEQCAGALVDALATQGRVELTRTVLAGHSMGGAIAIRLANRFTTAATIAYSPGPLVLQTGVIRLPYEPPWRLPSNLLILVGEHDIGAIERSAAALLEEAGGARESAEDFRSRQAVALRVVPWVTHTGLLFSAQGDAYASDWISQALDAPKRSVGRGSLWRLTLPAGLVLLFPLAASLGCRLCAPRQRSPQTLAARFAVLLTLWLGIASLVVLVLRWFQPLRFLHMYTGSYLTSFYLIGGLLLLIAVRWAPWSTLRQSLGQDLWSLRKVMAGAVVGMSTVMVFALVLSIRWADVWLNMERWSRFPVILAAVLPYFVLEELAMGPPQAGAGPWLGRLGRFFALRLALWLPMVGGLLFLGSGQMLLLLMGLVFAFFSLARRLGADAVWRRTGSAAAAAVFSAILAAWFIAAVFPLT
jgi:pimeloyl-ACP methyl ester carboxylesterase